ncbi:MAG: glycosyltransferase, partial [Bacteroidota bacterium]
LDLRPANHLANNYVSCRLFKNISYGALGLTNSIAAYEFFDGNIAFSADPENLFYVARDMQDRASTKERILHCMEKVKRHHTYINRLQDIITASEI